MIVTVSAVVLWHKLSVYLYGAPHTKMQAYVYVDKANGMVPGKAFSYDGLWHRACYLPGKIVDFYQPTIDN